MSFTSSSRSRKGNSLESRDVAHLLHPYTNLVEHNEKGPVIIEKAKGVFVYDNAGKEYIEGLSGLWCVALGYGNQRLIDVASKQMQDLAYGHLFASKSTGPAIELAEKLIEVAPVKMDKVFFANSGSEANDTMIKIVRYFNNARGLPKRKKIISRLGGYHGVTLASASLTGLAYAQNDFDLPIDGILHTQCPHYYRYGLEGESEQAYCERIVNDLETLIEKEGPETIAAFIAEPVMGAGGVITPPEGYFQKVQKILKQHNILFVADEVICGFGRLGKMWGSEVYHLQPDIITSAKALSSAYLPISAVMISKEIADEITVNSARHGVFGHGYTYSGHPVACAVALETIKIYQEENIVDHVCAVAPVMQEGLSALSEHSLVGEKRGIGLIGALQLVKDKDSKQLFDPGLKVAQQVAASAQAHGLMVRALPNDTVGLCPPLVIDEETLQKAIRLLGKALDDVAIKVR